MNTKINKPIKSIVICLPPDIFSYIFGTANIITNKNITINNIKNGKIIGLPVDLLIMRDNNARNGILIFDDSAKVKKVGKI